jgi:hypothetical protein
VIADLKDDAAVDSAALILNDPQRLHHLLRP